MKRATSPGIAVGDLVQVVRWPCCGALLGRLFTVGSIDQRDDTGWRCCSCKSEVPAGPWAVSAEDSMNAGGHISWLKRIPPLSDDERETEKLDLEECERFARLIKENT